MGDKLKYDLLPVRASFLWKGNIMKTCKDCDNLREHLKLAGKEMTKMRRTAKKLREALSDMMDLFDTYAGDTCWPDEQQAIINKTTNKADTVLAKSQDL
jgi:hypothetical protein